MSHTAIVEFPCHEGKGAALLAMLSAGLFVTRAFEGNESIEVFTDQENPDLLVLWEKWAARENYDAYLAWREETGLMDALALFMDLADIRITNLDAHPEV